MSKLNIELCTAADDIQYHDIELYNILDKGSSTLSYIFYISRITAQPHVYCYLLLHVLLL